MDQCWVLDHVFPPDLCRVLSRWCVTHQCNLPRRWPPAAQIWSTHCGAWEQHTYRAAPLCARSRQTSSLCRGSASSTGAPHPYRNWSGRGKEQDMSLFFKKMHTVLKISTHQFMNRCKMHVKNREQGSTWSLYDGGLKLVTLKPLLTGHFS